LSREGKHSSGIRRRYDPSIGPEEYEELCRRVEAVVRDATPPDAVVAVVSKGDPRLVEIEGRRGRHFPADAEGRYAGYHPQGSEDAIARVEALRGAGTGFLCLPATALWWLDHYQGLAAWLGAHCRVAARDPETCVVYDLLRAPDAAAAAAEPPAAPTARVRSLLDALLPDAAVLLVLGGSAGELAAPGREVSPLPAGRAEARRRLEGLKGEPQAFVLIARDGAAPSPDPALEDLLARRADLVARREGLCELLRIRSAARDRVTISGAGRGEDGSPPASGGALRGEAASRLARRLARLGLPGEDSSDRSGPPTSN
jgi:hypothetical protein